MVSILDIRAVIGKAPEPVPLDPVILDEEDCGTFTRYKVQYAAELNDRVPAYLFVPKGNAKYPAIYCHHQHASQFELGKSEIAGLGGDPDQALGPELARRGFVVLAPDAIGFEERNWSDRPGFAQYHELTSRLVRGETLLAKVLHDISVGVDYLVQCEWVDVDRIGFLGHSYGGRMAIWAPAFDTRIRASVSNCGCVNYRESLDRGVGIQAEFCVPGILEVADIEDIIRFIAPRSIYISATANDKYSIGAQDIACAVSDAFPTSNFDVKIWPGGHVFTQPMREQAYRFLDNQLTL
jgi:dienelactone hydrolase